MKKIIKKIILILSLSVLLQSCFLLGGVPYFEDDYEYTEIDKDEPSHPKPNTPTTPEQPPKIDKNPIGDLPENQTQPTNTLNKLEQEILNEINLVRQNPANYATNVMKAYRNSSRAANECYNELLHTKSMQSLKAEEGLYKAAQWFVRYQGPTGNIGHIADTWGYEEPWDRMSRFGMYYDGCAENISYGYNTAREIVLQLLIDEGIPNRGHRRNLLNPSFEKIGIAVGKHAKYRYMCVMDFAVDYKSY
ncbi:MAG: CAP domain-containing protein [Treponemataceae bacterium]